MHELPIVLSAVMVRAILDCRKVAIPQIEQEVCTA